MDKYRLQLTENEAATLANIDLEYVSRHRSDGHEAYKTNKKPILTLLQSLSNRNAIPEARLNYWNDARYQKSRIKASHKGLFERNGCTGSDIYTHPHFIRYLRYFLFGAELSDSVISEFEANVGNPQWVTSSDVIPIGKCARNLTRRHRLNPHDASEEFFKLCLDMGLSLSVAEQVMQSVKQVRT